MAYSPGKYTIAGNTAARHEKYARSTTKSCINKREDGPWLPPKPQLWGYPLNGQENRPSTCQCRFDSGYPYQNFF